MAASGHRQEALGWIREYWGGMVKEGATSFWEGYDPAGPDNQPGDADNAWVGKNQKLYEHAGTIAAIEMGARVYVGALGRFLPCLPLDRWCARWCRCLQCRCAR